MSLFLISMVAGVFFVFAIEDHITYFKKTYYASEQLVDKNMDLNEENLTKIGFKERNVDHLTIKYQNDISQSMSVYYVNGIINFNKDGKITTLEKTICNHISYAKPGEFVEQGRLGPNYTVINKCDQDGTLTVRYSIFKPVITQAM